jgi:hypothetical protein
VLAATRLGRGRVLVSRRAIEVMDAEELAAGVAHEVAHIRRRHRPVLLMASVLATIARPLPARGPPSAMSASISSATPTVTSSTASTIHSRWRARSARWRGASVPAAATSLGGRGAVTRRLAELLDGRGIRSKWVERGARALAATLAALVLALAAGGPASAVGSGADAPLVGTTTQSPRSMYSSGTTLRSKRSAHGSGRELTNRRISSRPL